MFHFIYQSLITLAISSAFLMSLGLFFHGINRKTITLALFYFSLGYLDLYLYLQSIDFCETYPFLYYTQVPFSLLVGPLLYLYVIQLLNDTAAFRKKLILCAVPVITGIALAVPIYLKSSAEKKVLIESFYAHPFLLFPPILLSIVTMFICSFLTFKRVRLFSKNRIIKKIRSNLFLMLFTLATVLFLFANGLFTVISFLLGFRLSLSVYIVSISIFILMVYFLNQRYIYLFVYNDSKNRMVSKNLLTGVDITLLQSKIFHLMDDQELYTREDLTLASLASTLSLTPHQLSQFLNKEFSRNFNSFVNYYRIEAAKKIITSEPQADLEAVAYTVGFNSYSTFLAAFKKQTGTSPKRFAQIS